MALWILAVLNVGLTLGLVARMQRFGAGMTIDSTVRLRAYQRFVVGQMWGALIIMGTVVLIPFVIIGTAVMMGDAAPSTWGPVALMAVPLLLRKQIRAVEQRCRSLPTTPALEAAYDSINKVWVGKALPRFESLPPLEQVTAPVAHMKCAVHGKAVPAGTCTRCGGYRCLACDRTRQLASTLCESCRTHFSELRRKGTAGERASRTAAYLVLTLGIVELTFGMGMLLDDRPFPAERGLGAVLLLLGALSSVGGILWGFFGELGRRLSLIASVLHTPIVPVGTAIGVYALLAAVRHHHITSATYAEAMRMSHSDRFAFTLIGALIATVAIPLYAGNLSGLGMAFLIFVARLGAGSPG